MTALGEPTGRDTPNPLARLLLRDPVPRSWLLRPLAIYAASRALTLLVFLLAATVASLLGEDLFTGRPWNPPSPGQSPTLTALTGWDSTWYVEIARHGYGERSSVMAFFPAFPLVVRLVAAVTGLSAPTAAVLSGLLFGGVAAVLLWQLSLILGDRAFADRSTALFAFFPGSVVFTMGYAEPMMLAASLGCLLSLLRRRWIVAGLCGALATATRPNAVVLVACCGWAAAVAIRRSSDWKALAAPLLATGGITAYFVFLWRRTGDVLAWFDIERELWTESFSPGSILTRAGDTFDQLTGRAAGPNLNPVLPTLGLLFAVMALVLLARWKPPAILAIYASGIALLAAGSATLGLRPRFLSTAFPLLQALAWRVSGPAYSVTLAVSAALLASLTFVTVLTMLATP